MVCRRDGRHSPSLPRAGPRLNRGPYPGVEHGRVQPGTGSVGLTPSGFSCGPDPSIRWRMALGTELTALTAVLLLATTACARASAEPVPAVAVVEQAASIQLLERLTAEAAASMPKLTGLPVSRARAILVRRGLRVQVVALQPGV